MLKLAFLHKFPFLLDRGKKRYFPQSLFGSPGYWRKAFYRIYFIFSCKQPTLKELKDLNVDLLLPTSLLHSELSNKAETLQWEFWGNIKEKAFCKQRNQIYGRNLGKWTNLLYQETKDKSQLDSCEFCAISTFLELETFPVRLYK